MRQTNKDTNGTSFYGNTITATIQELRSILGEPAYVDNSGEDKVNYEWEMETDDGDVFTVYDWKEYRRLKENEPIDWHIGGHNENATNAAADEIAEALA